MIILHHKGIGLLVKEQDNESVVAYAAWNDKIHGVAEYSRGNICLDLDKYKEIFNCPIGAHFSKSERNSINAKIVDPENIKGEELYDFLFLNISKDYPIESIEAIWRLNHQDIPTLNLYQYNKQISPIPKIERTLQQKIEAIQNTFSGKMAKKHEFNNVEIVEERGTSYITHLQTYFRK
jgi:hypothetical protein